jgi:transmembrane sensor
MSERPMSSPSPSSRPIEEVAAEWFGRCEIGLTSAEERDFVRWLEADPRHGEAMREMDETWDFLDRLKETKIRGVGGENLRAHAPGRKIARWQAVVLLASAAAVGLALIGPWNPRKEKPLVRHVVTEAGGMKKMELPDGSVIHLNANSSAEVRFTGNERRVELRRGEAHFAVAKDPARPFVVVAGDVVVRAVGTAFDVRREAHAVEVFVSEGKVRLDESTRGSSLLLAADSASATPSAAHDSPLLVAGQRALVSLDAADAPQPAVVAPIAESEIQQALAWRVRQLDFDMTPLAQVVAEFNRYNTHQLAIADAELARQPFGGSFRADNSEVFVRLLEQRFGVVAERAEQQTVLRRAK